MRVLTFGWEFPPSKNGGLGVACHGLTRELTQQGVEVIFVLPKKQPTVGSHAFRFADVEQKVKVRPVSSALLPYHSAQSVVDSVIGYDSTGRPMYVHRTILEEVHRFAEQATQIASEETFDIIHAHDWTSYLAGVAAKVVSGKPLILHVHATAFDQAASFNVDPSMYDIEREAFAMADSIVTVSEFTKNIVVEKYGADTKKVTVVHNGCDIHEPIRHEPTLTELKAQGKKIVLYLGRITIQKGVDNFVRAARRVVDVDPNIVFVIAGWGDMTQQIIQQIGALNLSGHVLFAGALWDDDRDRMYQSADLVVMPSVSEPFGLVPLEALQHGTPSIISKQSGVAEVLSHVLKVDFWDVDDMANKIIATLRYDALRMQMKNYGQEELKKLSWKEASHKILLLYRRMLNLLHT
ncbi:MAG: glycosyltransferase family 4 protein [Candidatus Paceibacteria bacterium]